jgi:hypothetical protein
MPPLPSVPGVARVGFQFQIGSDLIGVVRWYCAFSGGPPDALDCTALATYIFNAAATDWQPLMGPSTSLTGVDFLDLTTPSSFNGVHTGSVVGSRATTPNGAAVAVLESCSISRRYRGGKPRSYYPFGTAEDLLTQQTWTAAAVIAFNAGIHNVEGSISGHLYNTTTLDGRVNVSYYAGFTPVTNPITGRTKDVTKLRVGGPHVDVINSTAVSPKVASQRRRNLQRS